MSKQRTDKEIRKELETAIKEYHKHGKTMTVGDERRRSRDIQKLREELSAYYAHGAAPCPQCKTPPIGMFNEAGPRATIGCVRCPPEIIQREGQKIRRSRMAIGATPQEAVENWNAHQYKVDAV